MGEKTHLEQSSSKETLVEQHAIRHDFRFGEFDIGIAFWMPRKFIAQYRHAVNGATRTEV